MSINAGLKIVVLSLGAMLAGCSGNPTAKLETQLQDSDVELRRAAVRAIEQQANRDIALLPALTKSVADGDSEVRRLSIEALVKMGPSAQSAEPALVKALDDPELPVRLQAALAVQKLDPKSRSFVPVLDKQIRSGDGRLILTIGAMGKDAAWAVPALMALLTHESPKLKVLAAQTLGQIGPMASEAKPALQIAARDSNRAVQAAAQAALEKIQSTSGSPAK
ncbi:MAG TPA: HEAT repeat domain-containing protein [Pirellulales bacterium]|jgi:HEAT repeat protein